MSTAECASTTKGSVKSERRTRRQIDVLLSLAPLGVSSLRVQTNTQHTETLVFITDQPAESKTITAGQRRWRAGLPVRSTIPKPCARQFMPNG